MAHGCFAFLTAALILAAIHGGVMGTIETPCIKVCVISPQAGLCLGCGRSLTEIAHWLEFSPGQRHQIMLELPLRLSARPPQTTS